MGYMGLKNWGESDMAADLAVTAIDKMLTELKKGLKEKGNEYNTAGPENVAMFIESFIQPNIKAWSELYSGGLYNLIEETLDRMENTLEDAKKNRDWEDNSAKQHHVRAYERMVKNLKFVLKKLEQE